MLLMGEKTMSRFAYLAFAFALPIMAILPQDQQLTISADVRKQEFKIGSEVYVWLLLRNLSKHEIVYTDQTQECDYKIRIRISISGLELPLSSSAQEHCAKTREQGRRIRVVIKPGESRRDRVELSNLVNLSAAGDYSVRISRQLPDASGGLAVSNEVQFQIVP